MAPRLNEGPIGVFDSGIGGLSIVRALREELPSEEILYFADLARLPYGEKAPWEVCQFSLQIARFLLSRAAKILVVACSTASSVALPFLQQNLEVPIIGILNEELLEEIVASSFRKKVGVLATTLTAKSGSFRKWIQASHPEMDVILQPCSKLVDKISEGDLLSRETEELARVYLKSLIEEEKVDSIVLGCTHFNFIEEKVREILPREIALVTSPRSVARTVSTLLQRRRLKTSLRSCGRVQVATSKTDPVFSQFVQEMFGIPQKEIVLT